MTALPQSSASESVQSPVSQTARRCVLVVEDDRDSLLSLLALLQSEGHEAEGVTSAKAMWQKIDQLKPNVLLLDIGLPDASGYQIARDLRKALASETPLLIAVTGWNKSSDALLAKLAGFDYHLGKPYTPATLFELVSSPKMPQ